MASKRKGWDELSANYRKRLERGGITKTQYASGASLKKARGHEKTPEHPTEKDIVRKYPEYAQKRGTLLNRFRQRKRDLWGSAMRWSDEGSDANIRERKPTMDDLRKALAMTDKEFIDATRSIRSDETYRHFGYH